MNVLENNNVQASLLLANLLDAVTVHDTALLSVGDAFTGKMKALEALRSAGYKSMQAGSALRYNKNAMPNKGEYSYTVAVQEFTARFLAIKPQATQKQIDGNNKQRVATLNLWLKTGKFSSNVGKDGAKLEHVASLERVDVERQAVADAAKASSIADRQVKEAQTANAKHAASIKKIDVNDVEALAKADEKTLLLKAELTHAKHIAKTTATLANKAKAKLDQSNLEAQQAKDKVTAKNQAKIDVKKIAVDLASKLTAKQIEELISLLQAEL